MDAEFSCDFALRIQQFTNIVALFSVVQQLEKITDKQNNKHSFDISQARQASWYEDRLTSHLAHQTFDCRR